MKTIRNFATVVMAIVLAGCDGGFRNGHVAGDIENLENATVYHLADGVFIHEQLDGNDHYFLLDASAPNYELKPEGLEVESRGDWDGSTIGKRQPDDFVTAFILWVPGDGLEWTRFKVDSPIIEKIINEFNDAMTVGDIYNLKK